MNMESIPPEHQIDNRLLISDATDLQEEVIKMNDPAQIAETVIGFLQSMGYGVDRNALNKIIPAIAKESPEAFHEQLKRIALQH